MPYVLITRSDIDPGVLHAALDLKPNTSQRRFPYELVGQTGYRNPNATGAAPVVGSGVTVNASEGLVAWLLDNVSSASGTRASATITTDAVANLSDGETFTIDDGENSVTFEFIVTAGFPVASPNVAVDISGVTTADQVRDVISVAVNASILNVLAGSGGAGTVSLLNTNQNQPTADQNNSNNAETSASATFAITAFSSATDSDAMTPAEAAVSAQDILDELAQSHAINRSNINGSITTGVINKEDVADLLELLSGRTYELPAGVTLEAGGEFVGGGGSFTGPTRRIYETGDFKISFDQGRLSQLTSATYTFKGVQGSAVTVYHDDGEIYT